MGILSARFKRPVNPCPIQLTYPSMVNQSDGPQLTFKRGSPEKPRQSRVIDDNDNVSGCRLQTTLDV